MRYRKVYGQSKTETCPFCGASAIFTNKQGFPVCKDHKDAIMNDMRCACGEPLELKKGKFGMFFLCISCGPRNAKKVFELNEVKDISKSTPARSSPKMVKASELYNKAIFKEPASPQRPLKRKEITVTPDDPTYFS